jgi:Uma2 family endonuclease
MSRAVKRSTKSAREPEPAWDVALLFPAQGQWSEEEYLALDGNRIVEFSNGRLEVAPMPTTSHQLLVAWLYGILQAFVVSRDLGTVAFAPLRVRISRAKFREPDLVFMLKEHGKRIGEEYWEGADLVMEVVSRDEEGRRRDLETKRQEYARAGIPEYWTIDPEEKQITVLRLAGKRYAVHGEFHEGTVAASHLLQGFAVDVKDAFSKRPPAAGGKRTQTAERRRP